MMRSNTTTGGVLRKTLTEQVYRTLKEEIILQQTPELKMGARINEVELAARLGCSTTPLREALNMLRRDNLIVTNAFHYSEVVSFSRKDIHDLLSIREELELSALRQALPNITAEDIQNLKDIQVEYERVYRKSDFLETYVVNRKFHDYILSRADNRILSNLLDGLSEQCALLRSSSMVETRRTFSPCGVFPPVVEHGQILTAIEDGDSEAACQAMSRHIRRVHDDVCSYYDRTKFNV
ncbi:GntR family transcriptional regulator [Dysosmobacter sp.]|uniref:GntR family transcriptional regulator n=1 Tax=Dysosmobacter sp. TaxID=2591382 RepID=UPI002A8E6F9F|nr:GntR family transcriptional regulator [Dysosmobacter sp.]MDY3282463.1 GntR family transcriptional regulator [Dysosmobacter sp.]